MRISVVVQWARKSDNSVKIYNISKKYRQTERDSIVLQRLSFNILSLYIRKMFRRDNNTLCCPFIVRIHRNGLPKTGFR